MGRLADAWRALTAKADPGVVYGDTATLQAVEGLLAGAVPFGVPPMRGERELMVAAKRHPVLHAVTSRIAYDIAATPWQLFFAKNKIGKPEKRMRLGWGDRHQRRAYRVNRSTGQLRDDVEEVMDHPLLDLLHNLNPVMPGSIGLKVIQRYMDLRGEAFVGIERNPAGMPVALWPIPGYWVIRTPYYGSPLFHINFGTWVADLPERDVMWLKDPDPENPYWRGSGVAESCSDDIEIDQYAAKTLKAHFYNHGVPAGMGTLKGLSKPELDKFIEKYNEAHTGFWQSAKMFWTNTEIDLKSFEQNFVDQDILELRKDERDRILNTYGVPPEIIGILDNSNKATISESKSIYAENVLVPRLEFMRTTIQHRLVPEFDDRLVADYVDPSPDDQNFKLAVSTAAPWSRNKNEWRGLQALPAIEGPDGEAFPPMPTSAPKPPFGGPGDAPPPGKHFRRSAEEEDDDLVSHRDIDALVASVDDDDVSKPWEKHATSELEDWCADVAEQTGLEVDFQLINPRIAAYVRERGADKVKGLGKVGDTTREQLRQSLAEGIDAGESIPKLKARITDVFEDAQGYRAENIARTETTRASGFGTVTALKEGGIEAKEWISTRDSRTRDDHDAMDGQVVAIDEAFTTPSGEEADHPGDFDDPSEDCNCRCAAAAAEKTDKSAAGKKRRDAIWKAYDAKTNAWAQRTVGVLRKGFATQRRAVLAKLDDLSSR